MAGSSAAVPHAMRMRRNSGAARNVRRGRREGRDRQEGQDGERCAHGIDVLLQFAEQLVVEIPKSMRHVNAIPKFR